MAKKIKLHDKTGEQLIPLTRSTLVEMNSGESAQEKIDSLEDSILDVEYSLAYTALVIDEPSGGGGSSSSDGWAYYYEPSCYVDNMLQVYKYITISNVTLEVYYWGEIGPTGWITNNPVRAPNAGSGYIPVYFRAKATSSDGVYFIFTI